MPYKCAFGCTKYNPCCDACDSEVSDQSTGWAEDEKRTRKRFKAALRGLTLEEAEERELDVEDGSY